MHKLWKDLRWVRKAGLGMKHGKRHFGEWPGLSKCGKSQGEAGRGPQEVNFMETLSGEFFVHVG